MAARRFAVFVAGRVFLAVYNDCILGKFNLFHFLFLLLFCGLLLGGMIVGRFGLLCILGGRFVGRFGMIVGRFVGKAGVVFVLYFTVNGIIGHSFAGFLFYFPGGQLFYIGHLVTIAGGAAFCRFLHGLFFFMASIGPDNIHAENAVVLKTYFKILHGFFLLLLFGMIVGRSLLLLLLLFNPGNGGLFRLKPTFIAQLLAILQNVPGIIAILFIYDGIRGQAGRLLGGLAGLVAGKPCGLLAAMAVNCAACFRISAISAIHVSLLLFKSRRKDNRQAAGPQRRGGWKR